MRENFRELQRAQCRRVELETEYLMERPPETAVRPTKLSAEQLQAAELAVRLAGDDWPSLPLAVQQWKLNKSQIAVESPRLDEAIEAFRQWLDMTPTLRPRTKQNLRVRANVFGNSVPNLRLADISADTIESFLAKRNADPVTRDGDKRALSRFFSWCIERPRRWLIVNPCAAVKVERGEKPPPAILSVDQCQKLLAAAEKFKRGRLAPYLAVTLFGGLRPFEASRLTWQAVNLADGEIRLEANQTKTGRPRVVSICPTLRAWLAAYKDREFFPSNWRKDFDFVKEVVGFGTPTEEKPKLTPWPEDVLRHTAVSHFFRRTGSYGQTAEQFGNSEAIIKQYYQGRVSSEDTERFYALTPKGKRS